MYVNEHTCQKKDDQHKKKFCSHCDYKSDSVAKVKYHIDSKHQDSATQRYFCANCKKGFIFEETLLNYHKNHCTKSSYVTRYEQAKRKRSSHTLKVNLDNLECEDCGKKFASQSMLDRHLRSCQNSVVCELSLIHI